MELCAPALAKAYAVTFENMTKKDDFMYYYVIGLITGLAIGFLVSKLVSICKKGIDVQIVGLNISIRAIERVPVVPMEKPKEKVLTKLKLSNFGLCNDEDMFIAGTKNLIPCPKCKRNSNKFKKDLI